MAQGATVVPALPRGVIASDPGRSSGQEQSLLVLILSELLPHLLTMPLSDLLFP